MENVKTSKNSLTSSDDLRFLWGFYYITNTTQIFTCLPQNFKLNAELQEFFFHIPNEMV